MNENIVTDSLKSIPASLFPIIKKIESENRISYQEGVTLYSEASLGLLAFLANLVNERINQNQVYFNRNIHIEPTNHCIYNCKFCSYSASQSGFGWKFSSDEIIKKIEESSAKITEVHIVGGVFPEYDMNFYTNLFASIKQKFPKLHIKALTAVEIRYLIEKEGLTLDSGIQLLKNSGLDSVPGGGAEIFDEKVREIICGKKDTATQWLELHEHLHKNGVPSNATILYGHIESIENRIDHLERLRSLQDKTGGFNAFIPLKFRNKHNQLADVPEVHLIEDLKMFAISRIYLDNIPHLKSYWPMLGKQTSQLLLDFGVDDIDGTINDSTKIYSMAGAEETKPEMSTSEMVAMIKQSGRIAVERDSVYNIIEKWS